MLFPGAGNYVSLRWSYNAFLFKVVFFPYDKIPALFFLPAREMHQISCVQTNFEAAGLIRSEFDAFLAQISSLQLSRPGDGQDGGEE